jgi:hypothetical protein
MSVKTILLEVKADTYGLSDSEAADEIYRVLTESRDIQKVRVTNIEVRRTPNAAR